MSQPTVLAQNLSRPVALRPRAGFGDLVVAQRRGSLVSVDVTSGATATLTTVPGWVRAFDVSPDGSTAYAGGRLLGVVNAPLDGGAPTPLMRRAGRPGAVLADPDGTRLHVAEGGQPGRIFQLDLSPRRAVVLASGFPGVRGLLFRTGTGEPVLLDEENGGRLVALDGDVLASGFGIPADAAWRDSSETSVLVAAGGRVLEFDLDAPGSPPAVLADGLGDVWAARPLADGRIAIGAGADVLLLDTSAPPAPVELVVPRDELFIGGWVTVKVVINDAAIPFDDLDFVVDPQEGGELVSLSRDNSFDPQAPTVVLSAGWLTGRHKLSAIRRSSGDLVGAADFEVLDAWTDQKWGPSFATFGSVEGGPTGSTWGGGDSGDFTVPQNVEVYPTTGTYRVGVVLVETGQANAQYPADLAPILDGLRDELFRGVAIGGTDRSTARYLQEASAGALTVEFTDPVGPIALPNGWTSYFTMNDLGNWKYNDDLPSTVLAEIVRRNRDAAAAGQPPFLDLAPLDSVLYVVRSRRAAGPATPRLSAWPYASRVKHSQIIGSLELPVLGLSVPITKALAQVFMPDDWATEPGNTRQLHETLAHELLHNFGVADQYEQNAYTSDAKQRVAGSGKPTSNPTGAARGSWEIMAWEENLPLPSAAVRLMLGWLPKDKVRLYNFGVFGPMDETITLHGAGVGPVPPGRWGAAEVRLEDGLNYYLEYRPTVTDRIVDVSAPQADAVVVTEALTRKPEPTDRSQVLLVENDADAVTEFGSFVAGEDYRERDTTTPGFEQDFIVDVVSTDDESASIRVRYAADLKPDPGIRPWVPSNNWQSPDFEVVNGRNMADPRFRNIPWEGRQNFLRVTVHNWGTSDANDVRVRFFVKDFTLGTGTEQPLGEASATIPAGGSAVLQAPIAWVPPVVRLPFLRFTYTQHSCVVARIAPFLDPVTGILEVTPENNEAQSNYTWAASTTSSPASREVTTVLLQNPWPVPAVMSVTVHQPHPLFRVYLGHRWVRLEPGEEQRVLVMVESLLGDPRFADYVAEFPHYERLIESTLRLSMLGDNGGSCAAEPLGGASILTVTGVGTRFDHFATEGGLAVGRVVQSEDGAPVSGRVLVSISPADPEAGELPFVREGDLFDGEFRIEHGRAEQGRWTFAAFYRGQYPWAPCESDVLAP